ncbi:MAG TPA: DUF1203 domain-containing protein [Thermoanaerobaculia bacterium]|nr:DUF1203 domain-containing protein [Thermoanaerobaculia bacterium]
MNVTVAALPAAFLDRVRNEGIDDLGQPVKRVIAEGGEPCRDVLRRAKPGEELILASFSPFSRVGPYREFGPVFVLAQPSAEEVARNAFPETGGERYLREQFVIRAYSPNEEIVDAAMTTSAKANETVERLLAREDTAFLHVRFPTYGCFALRVDRAS